MGGAVVRKVVVILDRVTKCILALNFIFFTKGKESSLKGTFYF